MSAALRNESFASWDDERFEAELARVSHGVDEPRIDEEPSELELVAAAVHLASMREIDQPPASVIDRLRGQAAAYAAAERAPLRALPNTGAHTEEVSGRPAALSWAGWGVAASLLFLFLLGSPPPLDPARARETLVAAADTIVVEWTQGTDTSAGAQVSGDVVWNPARQAGFMRFVDLQPNVTGERQYQLWIIDGDRPTEPPVDGGVFDVTSGGEVVVPIDPKLSIGRATVFAVTVEKPGGVVVSDKGAAGTFVTVAAAPE